TAYTTAYIYHISKSSMHRDLAVDDGDNYIWIVIKTAERTIMFQGPDILQALTVTLKQHTELKGLTRILFSKKKTWIQDFFTTDTGIIGLQDMIYLYMVVRLNLVEEEGIHSWMGSRTGEGERDVDAKLFKISNY
ncbi:hypothetical protein ACJX0J_011810, partial [Zea mays]